MRYNNSKTCFRDFYEFRSYVGTSEFIWECDQNPTTLIIYVIRYKEIPSTLEMISKLSKFYFNSLYPKLCCSVPDFFHSSINHKMSRAESIIQTNKNGFSKPMLACAWMPLCKSSRNLSNIWARTLKIHPIKNRDGMKVSGTKGKLLGNLELKQCASCFRVDGNFCHAVKFTKNYGIFWSCKVMENYCLNPLKP